MRRGAGSLQTEPTSQPTCSTSPPPPPCLTWGKMAKGAVLLGNMVSMEAERVHGTELCAYAAGHRAALAMPVCVHTRSTRSHTHIQTCCAFTRAPALRCTEGDAYVCDYTQIYGMPHNHPGGANHSDTSLHVRIDRCLLGCTRMCIMTRRQHNTGYLLCV